MKTDIPLRTLTKDRPSDLRGLLGTPDATVVDVLSAELPMVSTAVDNLVRMRSPAGTLYLHLVEWQGYRDTSYGGCSRTWAGWPRWSRMR
jgi:hypothetical protein